MASPALAQSVSDQAAVARTVAHQSIVMQDLNDDGVIDPSESDGFAQMLFHQIDSNADGKVSSEELTQATLRDMSSLRIIYNPSAAAQDVSNKMRTMDLNGDGSVSLLEMRMVTEQVFEDTDRNADGLVTLDELLGRLSARVTIASN